MLSAFDRSQAPRARTLPLALATLTLAALGACGGGGSGTPPTSTVSSVSVAATRYGNTAIVTMSGTALDSSGLAVTSPGCQGMTRLTSGATKSTATTAYYSCTVWGTLTSTSTGGLTASVVVTSNGASVASTTFNVPMPQVTMTVSNGENVNGTIVLTLYADKAPVTVANFLSYVNTSFYNGTIFHRYSPLNNLVQGGGYTQSSNGILPSPKATNAPIAYESGGGANLQWTVGMARSTGLDTATSQFYINLAANPAFDSTSNPYAVFGIITPSSEAVVEAMTTAPCVQDLNDLPPSDCLPTPNIVIQSATQSQ